MPKVFISHSSLDREFVEREIISLLRTHGIDAWYSTDSIRTTELWEKSIREGLKKCDWFLIAMSPNSVSSKWVPREILWAMERREGRIIPVLIESCDPEDLHLGLLAIQHIDFRHNLKKAQSELLAIWGISDKVTELYQQALAEISKANWAEAIEYLKKLLELNPNHAKAKDELRHAQQQKFLASLYEAGLNHFKEKRWHESLEDLRQVRELAGEYKEVVSLITEAESELAKLEEERKAKEEERKAKEAASRLPATNAAEPVNNLQTDKSSEEAKDVHQPTASQIIAAPEVLPTAPTPETKAAIESQEVFTSLHQPERKVNRLVWIIGGALLLSSAILIIVISRSGNKARSTSSAPPISSNVASNVNSNQQTNFSSANSSVPAQESASPTPTPTLSKVQLRITQTEGNMDLRNWPVEKSNIRIQAGGEMFEKLTNSDGAVVFDDVLCGGTITITAYDSSYEKNKVFQQKIGCDKPLVEFVVSKDPMTQSNDEYQLKQGKPGQAASFDGAKEKWYSRSGKLLRNAPE